MRLEVKNVSYRYKSGPWILKNISFEVDEDERVGLVGPSGYGKSTLSKLLAGYLRPLEGEILLDGKPLPDKGYCPIQLIYQHPEKAMNPRWRMKDILNESWIPDEVFLKEMGIEHGWLHRWPGELSGGQMQRFCIARALGPKTRFILADEMTTMFDSITQARIWEVMLKAVKLRKLGLIAITHNEALADRICTRERLKRILDPFSAQE